MQEFKNKDAVARLASYFQSNAIVAEFTTPILDFYEQYLVLKEEDLRNSSVTINNSENINDMFLTEVLFELKTSNRVQESIVHEMLHLQLKMKNYPIEIGIGEKDDERNYLMSDFVNHIEHFLIFDTYLKLGFEKNKFASQYIRDLLSNLNSDKDLLLAYLAELSVEAFLGPDEQTNIAKKEIINKYVGVNGPIEGKKFDELVALEKTLTDLDPRGYVRVINRLFQIFGKPSFTNYIRFDGPGKVIVVTI